MDDQCGNSSECSAHQDIKSTSGDVSSDNAIYRGNSDFRLFNVVLLLRNVISNSELTMLMSGAISFTLDGAKTQAALNTDKLVENSFENLDLKYSSTGLTLSFPYLINLLSKKCTLRDNFFAIAVRLG